MSKNMSATVLPVPQMVENKTETESSSAKDAEMPTIQIFLLLFNVLSLLLSIICLITHLIKFLRTNTAQTLATRNLTTYCAYLLIIHFISYILVHIFDTDNLFQKIDLFARISLSCSLFVLAFDTCLCLRNTVVHLTASSSSESNSQKFLTYRLFEISASLLLTAFVEYFATENRIRKVTIVIVILSIRLSCVLLCIASIRYIQMASINKTKLLHDFSLYLRLLVITGTTSVALCTAWGFMAIFYEKIPENLDYATEVLHNAEGLLIGILFTFKKNTFKMKVDRSIAFRNSSKSTTTVVLSPKLSVISHKYLL